MPTPSINKTRETSEIPLRKVRKFYQVSLPTRLSRKLGIAEGDYVEMQETRDGILVKPVSVAERVPAARLTPKEQQLLLKAKDKVARIKKDLVSARGLTEEEARVAAKVGLIDPEQMWWWLESWQKGEREADKALRARKVKEFDNVEALIRDLRS